MFTQNLSALTSSQIGAITQAVQTMDDLVEAASTFVLKGGQSYRDFLETREKCLDDIYKVVISK